MNYKRILSALSAAAAALSVAVINVSAEEQVSTKAYLKLDVNEDRAVNAVDASAVLTEYAQTSIGRNGSFSETIRYVADYDHNGTVNAIDASGILSAYVDRATGKDTDSYGMVTFYVEYWIDKTKGTIYGDSYEECLDIISAEKKKLSQPENSFFQIVYSEIIFGDNSDWIIEPVYKE